MDELDYVSMLNSDSKLFDDEFNNLKKFYTLNNEKEIWDFIKIHPGVIVLLNAYEQSLKKYFTGAVFELKFNPDLSGSWFDLIALTVWVDEETFNRLPNLKYIGICATGYNVVDVEAASLVICTVRS